MILSDEQLAYLTEQVAECERKSYVPTSVDDLMLLLAEIKAARKVVAAARAYNEIAPVQPTGRLAHHLEEIDREIAAYDALRGDRGEG